MFGKREGWLHHQIPRSPLKVMELTEAMVSNPRGIRGFVPPIKSNGGNNGNVASRATKGDDALEDSTKKCLDMLCGPDGELPEKLRNLEPRLIEHINNEIMDRDPNVRWDDIAGLHHANKCVTEMVIWPLLRPDIFKGCRSPGRGLLLFGPPGTGKTMIGKAIAGEAKATFFYISASSLTSKWEVCGNRTELCHLRNKYIRLREKVAHDATCSGVPAEIPRMTQVNIKHNSKRRHGSHTFSE